MADEERPPELDPAARARREAALRLIRTYGDPALRGQAVPVARFDAALRWEVERMAALMDDAIGIGLAATQLGVMHRLLVYRVEPDGPLGVLADPALEWASEETEPLDEGCLSLPRVLVPVERPIHVRVAARDERGEPIVVEASGLEARVIQHEMDHLDGVLILDRASKADRRAAMRAMRDREREAAAGATAA